MRFVPPRQLRMPDQKFQMIIVDIFGEGALKVIRHKKLVLVVVDRVSNFTQCFPISSKRGSEIWRTLEERWCTSFGKPKVIAADRGIFGTEMEKKLEGQGIRTLIAASYDHRQVGVVERINGYLDEQFKVCKLDEEKSARDWTAWLPIIVQRYNAGWVSAIGESPYYVVFGQEPEGSCEVEEINRNADKVDGVKRQEIMQAAIDYRSKQFEARKEKVARRETQLDLIMPGVLVWWKGNPAKAKFEMMQGPFRVCEAIGSNVLIGRNLDTGKKVRMSGRDIVKCEGEDCEV